MAPTGQQRANRLVPRLQRRRNAHRETVKEKARMAHGDKPIPEDDAIAAAHPLRTGRHDLYDEAQRLVSAKHSKGALVDLVNWLLHRQDAAETDLKNVMKQALYNEPDGVDLANRLIRLCLKVFNVLGFIENKRRP